MRERVAEHGFPHAETQPEGRLTVSIGVATCPDDAPDLVGLIRAADAALYAAKHAGRDRVVIATKGGTVA